ncbi:MAG: XdhC family protein, partial [Alphaproteobacteria bacterium]|nr:XdhC family protein [Alphaproteobacteria bacterium]
MRRDVLEALNRARQEGRAVVRACDLETGEEHLLDPERDDGPLGTAAREAARADQSRAIEVEGRSWFLTVSNPPLDLAIVGAVHIAQPLSVMAELAGYRVRILDPRTAFATRERFPRVELSHDWPDEALAKSPLGFRSALVALTHDPKLDDPALSSALKSRCFYIGALGSKKNHAARLERLRAQGFDHDALSRIHGPIGLAIG